MLYTYVIKGGLVLCQAATLFVVVIIIIKQENNEWHIVKN